MPYSVILLIMLSRCNFYLCFFTKKHFFSNIPFQIFFSFSTCEKLKKKSKEIVTLEVYNPTLWPQMSPKHPQNPNTPPPDTFTKLAFLRACPSKKTPRRRLRSDKEGAGGLAPAPAWKAKVLKFTPLECHRMAQNDIFGHSTEHAQ